MNPVTFILTLSVLTAAPATQPQTPGWPLDETPPAANEWGFRPANDTPLNVTPPAFVWRPQSNAAHYHLQVARDDQFRQVQYEAANLDLYCHCPPKALEPGTWHWRFRAVNKAGVPSAWSTVRSFTISSSASEMPMPDRAELRARVPGAHPRLFLRPEDLPRLRQQARSNLSAEYQALDRQCKRLLKDPPPTAEPKKYPPGMKRGSEEWRELWWDNRVYTINVLDSAATLAFVRLLDGNEQYGQLARRLLLDAARWDPKGATGYRYNDEAGMPYAYYFTRTYTFLYDLLTEQERDICRKVMRVRGREMYDHLRPMHIWRPYGSHANRAWHFLGEVGIAFLDEIPEAEEWMWFAMNVFYCAYPVWCDDDGGWHEGMAYWRSYIDRFTWWADVIRSAFNIEAYQKPYFSQIGYYPLYLQPPGTYGGGFGDLCGRLKSSGNVPLMQIFAGQAGNPYWRWYVEAHGKPARQPGYVGFLRSTRPPIQGRQPTDLPTARLFRGTGQAALNSNLLNAKDNVQILFKSSPFGTQSHGYDANNAFLLSAFGTPLFISSGWRDIYGSEHHAKWMWHTKSTNSITVDGEGQLAHSPRATGRILDFATTDDFDFVSGEAGPAYDGKLNRFTREILFIKPELIVIHDLLEAPAPARFEWRLHSPARMQLLENQRVHVTHAEASCDVAFLTPQALNITQTDQFDPPPRPRIKLTEYHLTAATDAPRRECEFITILRPYRTGQQPPDACRLIPIDGGTALEANLSTGKAVVLLRRQPGGTLTYGPLQTQKTIAAARINPKGETTGTFEK